MLQFLHGLLRRQDRLQSLDHGTTVIASDPGSQCDHFIFYTGLFFRQSCDLLDLLRSELTLIPYTDHITLDQTVSIAERDHNTGSRLQSVPQSLRYPVLKCLIQFFMRDIYNDIRI